MSVAIGIYDIAAEIDLAWLAALLLALLAIAGAAAAAFGAWIGALIFRRLPLRWQLVIECRGDAA